MKFRILALLLVLLFSAGVFSAAVTTGYTLAVSSTSTSPINPYAGDEISVLVNLENSASGVNLENIDLTLVAPEQFEMINNNVQIAALRSNGNTSAVFKVKAKEDATEGTYTFTLFLNYDTVTTSTARPTEQISTFGVTLKGVYSLDVVDIKSSNPRPHILEPFKVEALLNNDSGSNAKNIVAELSLDGHSSLSDFILLDGVSREISSINGNSSKLVSFELMPAKTIAVGTYTFDINVSCENCVKSSRDKTAVEVLGRPNLIVSGVDYSIENKNSKTLFQGDSFSLAIQLDNLGEEKAKAVEVSIVTDDGFEGSKKTFIGSIDSDDSGSAIFDLVIGAVPAGDHTFEIKIDYINELDEPTSIRESLDLTVNALPFNIWGWVSLLVFLSIFLGLLYVIIRMVLRYLALKKLEKG